MFHHTPMILSTVGYDCTSKIISWEDHIIRSIEFLCWQTSKLCWIKYSWHKCIVWLFVQMLKTLEASFQRALVFFLVLIYKDFKSQRGWCKELQLMWFIHVVCLIWRTLDSPVSISARMSYTLNIWNIAYQEIFHDIVILRMNIFPKLYSYMSIRGNNVSTPNNV